MSGGRRSVRDLVEEAKKRAVLLFICVIGLSYLMSLTSSSVWVNLPAAAALILFGRYISLDLDVRRRTTIHDKLNMVDQSAQKKSIELKKFPPEKPNWRRKVNSPAVEEAIDQFTRHIVSEWVTDLWYSRITPDRDGPEALVQIINNVLGEISLRARDINLINLLTRDIINLLCSHIELYRLGHSKIKQDVRKLPIDLHDAQLRLVLEAENKLHPALFSGEAEHKVLQHLMNGLIQLTFRHEDLQCSFFRFTVRESLACAVFRPVLNLANPRVINEKIESLVISLTNKSDKRVMPSAEEVPGMRSPPKPLADQVSGFLDRSSVGVELVQVRHARLNNVSDEGTLKGSNGKDCQEDNGNSCNEKTNVVHSSGAEWAQMLDKMSRRKTQVLAPENLESMWTKGRYYKKKENAIDATKGISNGMFMGHNDTSNQSNKSSNYLAQDKPTNFTEPKKTSTSSYNVNHNLADNFQVQACDKGSAHHFVPSFQDRTEYLSHEEAETDTESSYQTEEDDGNIITGLDSPGTRVWDSKNKRNVAVSRIHHPLETSELHSGKKKSRSHVPRPRTVRTSSGRKRPRSGNLKVPVWQEVERTSFLLGQGKDILNEAKRDPKMMEPSDDPEAEMLDRVHSGDGASTSLLSASASESCISSLQSTEGFVLTDTFLKLRCEVVGANIVKSGSVSFAVYSIYVTDANNNSWSIKRRYRHFEELHKRLKEFPEYNLSLPPKHFLSSGLDVPVVQERCKLLDIYLKMLLQIPSISGSIEVWDFLSVDSQTYMFSDSLSIIQTLSVNLADKPYENAKVHTSLESVDSQLLLSSSKDPSSTSNQHSVQMNKNYAESDTIGLRKRSTEQNYVKNPTKEPKSSSLDTVGSNSEGKLHKKISSSTNDNEPEKVGIGRLDDLQDTSRINEIAEDTSIPTEWVPPNLSIPILNLVDVVFQLQDGGWIRRQTFWVAKQLLQLGMGDAFDDWLIEKIQLLRKDTIVASTINRVEKILWPDGIFITKHPNRKPPTPVSSPASQTGKNMLQKEKKVENQLTPEQQLEAAQRAKFVYELIIDKAPAALVNLVGRKEYERCAQDLYFFLQSPVCLKQLALELLELILLALFPELDAVVRQCHKDKEQFGALEDQ